MGNGYNSNERRNGERKFQVGTVWTMLLMTAFICGLVAKVVIADTTVKETKEMSRDNKQRIEKLEKEFIRQRVDLSYIKDGIAEIKGKL